MVRSSDFLWLRPHRPHIVFQVEAFPSSSRADAETICPHEKGTRNADVDVKDKVEGWISVPVNISKIRHVLHLQGGRARR